MSINKLYKNDNYSYDLEIKNEKIYNNGSPIGNFNATFHIINNLYVKQMICGVKTEDGIKKSDQIYLSKYKIGSNKYILPSDV